MNDKIRQQQTLQYQHIFLALGTVNNITVFERGYDDVIHYAKQRVLELHCKFNAYDKNSEISAINQSAGKEFVTVSEDTYHVIEKSVYFSQMTGGLFDITTRALSELWKEAIKSKIPPSESETKKVQTLTNYHDILLDKEKQAVMLKKYGQQIDLGAIAKGYVAEEIRNIFLKNSISQAIINLGGTVINMGTGRNVGIQNPFENTGKAFAYITTENKAVVSSGLYEQGFAYNGKTYHHIINPKTGYPSQSQLAGITLIGDNAETLDALSTVAFMMNMGKAVQLLNSYGIEAVFITQNREIYTTRGLTNQLTFC